jgi:hypothetical protein
VERTLTCADPATGLRVRCDLTEYDGLPAVEWVLHFENRGTQDTPILERILPPDTAFKTEAQANVVVHHSFYFAFKMRLNVVKSGHGKTTPD